jgi:hypothetical protein
MMKIQFAEEIDLVSDCVINFYEYLNVFLEKHICF